MISNNRCPIYPMNENEKSAVAEVVSSINKVLLPEEFDDICLQFPKYKLEFCYGIFEGSAELTVIHQAITHKNYKLANHIALKLGPEGIDVVNSSGITALRFLIFNAGKIETFDHWNLAKTLLALGAKVNLGTVQSSLKCVAGSGDKKFTALLLDYKAKKLEKERFIGLSETTYKAAKKVAKEYNDKKCILIFNFSQNLHKELISVIARLFQGVQFQWEEKK